MSCVLVLGAGASICAGYPSAKNLLAEVGGYCSSSCFADLRDRWTRWVTFRDAAGGTLRNLLDAPNPEYVLSVLDLVEHRHENWPIEVVDSAVEAERNGNYAQHERRTTEWKARHGRDKKLRNAREDLITCIERFFRNKMLEENEELHRSALTRLLSDLAPGDTVITFNWDTLAERSLGARGAWNPTSGYGLSLPLRRRGMDEVPRTWPSAVHVLKLHGCFGWGVSDEAPDRILLSREYLLDQLGIHLDGHCYGFLGEHEMSIESRLSLLPTFLKHVPQVGVMQEIWWRAQQALTAAKRVEVWGYSLPESDAAARVLFNALRFRLSAREVEAEVYDPCSETRDRWDAFLGARVSRNLRLECKGA